MHKTSKICYPQFVDQSKKQQKSSLNSEWRNLCLARTKFSGNQVVVVVVIVVRWLLFIVALSPPLGSLTHLAGSLQDPLLPKSATKNPKKTINHSWLKSCLLLKMIPWRHLITQCLGAVPRLGRGTYNRRLSTQACTHLAVVGSHILI